jgi:uncharacterized protein YidB (DUF937 family)
MLRAGANGDLRGGANVNSLDDLLGGAGGSGGGGLGDLLGGILGGGGSGGSGSALGGGGNPLLRMLLPMLAGMLMNGGLQKILGRLQQGGRASAAESWVSPGANEPLDADGARAALGDEEIASIAERLGLSEDEAAQAVARVLPDVVDQATPEGSLPPDDELDQRFGRLHELQGTSG